MTKTPRKFSIQQVFEILLQRPVDNKIVAFLTDVKTSGIENTVEMTYPTGGRGNVYVGGGFAHSRRATSNVSNATWNTEVMAVQNGTELSVGETTVKFYDAGIVRQGGKYKTTKTPVGTAGSEIGFVYVLNNDGTYGKFWEQVGSEEVTPATGKFIYDSSSKEFTFPEEDAPAEGDKLACAYIVTAGEDTQRISVVADAVPAVVIATMYGLARDICTGELFRCQVNGQAQIDGNWSMELTADGEPAVHNMNLEFVKSCTSNRLYDFTVYAEEDII